MDHTPPTKQEVIEWIFIIACLFAFIFAIKWQFNLGIL